MKSENMHCLALWAVALLATSCAWAVIDRSDFVSGEGVAGWTISGNEYVSPVYSSAVDRISLAYSGGTGGSATISAVRHQCGESQVATLSAVSSSAIFDFSGDTDFRSFRVSTAGDWRLLSFAADVSASHIDAPSNVVATALTTDSLEISWNPVQNATGYRVSIWTNMTVGAEDGIETWVDDFSNAQASSTSAGALNSSTFNSSCSDTQYWECNEYIYPSTTTGVIRLGASDKGKGGELLSPHLPAGDWHLRMRAWRYSADDGTDMPIMRNSGGVTSLVQIVKFTKEPGVPEEFMIRLPTLLDGDHLMFCSFTNKKPRVILDRVALVSGYSAGTNERDVIREIPVSDASSCTVDNLPESIPVFVDVTAIGAHNLSSAASGNVFADLANPPPRAILNAFPMSSLADLTYSQDFDSLDALSSGASWYNGVTLPFWQAYRDNAQVEKIYRTSGTGTSQYLYILSTNTYERGCALGAYISAGSSYVWGMAFTNDTERPMELVGVSYMAGQWGFKNSASQTVSFSLLVTNRLVDVACESERWVSDEAWSFTSPFADEGAHQAPQTGDVEMPIRVEPSAGIRVPIGGVLILRWEFARPRNQSGKAAILAIDDVEVTFRKCPQPLYMFIARDGGINWL